jgi:hypothetical protein
VGAVEVEEAVSRRTKRRELRRAIARRARDRQRNGRMVCMVEVDEAMIDVLVRAGVLADGISDRREIAGAIVRLVRSRDQSR